jgi:hypothetical protein
MYTSIIFTFTALFAFAFAEPSGGLKAQNIDSIPRIDIFTKLAQTGQGGASIQLKGADLESTLSTRIQRTRTPQIANGWRIRIFRDSRQDGRSRAEQIVQRIRNEYAGTSAYASYDAPYWYVAVGDYRTKEDAEKTRRLLARSYPTASLINTAINLPPL